MLLTTISYDLIDDSSDILREYIITLLCNICIRIYFGESIGLSRFDDKVVSLEDENAVVLKLPLGFIMRLRLVAVHCI